MTDGRAKALVRIMGHSGKPNMEISNVEITIISVEDRLPTLSESRHGMFIFNDISGTDVDALMAFYLPFGRWVTLSEDEKGEYHLVDNTKKVKYWAVIPDEVLEGGTYDGQARMDQCQ